MITLKAQITTSADETLKYFVVAFLLLLFYLSYFSERKGLSFQNESSHDLSSQIVSEKNNINFRIVVCHKFAQRIKS